MKKRDQSKKPSKKPVAPVKESGTNSIAKRMGDIEVKLKEKLANVQKIFNEYKEFDINISVKEKLQNLKTQMLTHELVNADIIMLINSVLNNGCNTKGENMQNEVRKGNVKVKVPEEDNDEEDEEDEEDEQDDDSEKQSEDIEEESEQPRSKKSQNSTKSQTKVKPKQKANSLQESSKNKRARPNPPKRILNSEQTSSDEDTSPRQKQKSNKKKSSAVLPKSKGITKQQPISVKKKDNTEQQTNNRIKSKKLSLPNSQTFQKYKKDLQKAGIEYTLQISQYFLDEVQFKKRQENKLSTVGSMLCDEDKQCVVNVFKALQKNYARVSQLLGLSKQSIQKLVVESQKRRKVIRNNTTETTSSMRNKQSKDRESQRGRKKNRNSKEEEEDSDYDEGQEESEDKRKKRLEETSMFSTEELPFKHQETTQEEDGVDYDDDDEDEDDEEEEEEDEEEVDEDEDEEEGEDEDEEEDEFGSRQNESPRKEDKQSKIQAMKFGKDEDDNQQKSQQDSLKIQKSPIKDQQPIKIEEDEEEEQGEVAKKQNMNEYYYQSQQKDRQEQYHQHITQYNQLFKSFSQQNEILKDSKLSEMEDEQQNQKNSKNKEFQQNAMNDQQNQGHLQLSKITSQQYPVALSYQEHFKAEFFPESIIDQADKYLMEQEKYQIQEIAVTKQIINMVYQDLVNSEKDQNAMQEVIIKQEENKEIPCYISSNLFQQK